MTREERKLLMLLAEGMPYLLSKAGRHKGASAIQYQLGVTHGSTAVPEVEHSCNFCGEPKSRLRYLVAGPGVCICDGCIDLCVDELKRHLGTQKAEPVAVVTGEVFFDLWVHGVTVSRGPDRVSLEEIAKQINLNVAPLKES